LTEKARQVVAVLPFLSTNGHRLSQVERAGGLDAGQVRLRAALSDLFGNLREALVEERKPGRRLLRDLERGRRLVQLLRESPNRLLAALFPKQVDALLELGLGRLNAAPCPRSRAGEEALSRIRIAQRVQAHQLGRGEGVNVFVLGTLEAMKET